MKTVRFLVLAMMYVLQREVAVDAAPDNSAFKASELPALEQNRDRVLAVINGVWDWEKDTNTESVKAQKLELLYNILQSYRHACEDGFEVHVVLATYKVENESLQIPSASNMFCDRLGRAVPVAVERFDWEPLPEKAIGTGGTLASKHRLLFAQAADKYDYYISQEDDHVVKAHSIRYFSRWAPQVLETRFYPRIAIFEVLDNHLDRKQVSSRYSSNMFRGGRSFYLRNVLGDTWIEDKRSAANMHMLSHEMLRVLLEEGYHTADRILPNSSQIERSSFGKEPDIWEYNQWYNQWFLRDRFTSLAVPIKDFDNALVHHASNKYSNDIYNKREEIHGPLGFTVLELKEVLFRCTGEHFGQHLRKKDRRMMHVTMTPAHSFPCRQCLDNSLTVEVEVHGELSELPSVTYENVEWDFILAHGHRKHINVSVTCHER